MEFTPLNSQAPSFLIPSRKRQSGFTLIELLIVIVAIGVFSSIAVLSIGTVAHRQLRSDVDCLRILLQQTSDYALYQQTTLGLSFPNNQYQLLALEKYDLWQVFDSDVFENSQCSEKLIVKIVQPVSTHLVKGQYEDNNAVINFDSPTPSLIFSSDGLYTPFKLLLSHENSQTKWLLQGDGFSAIFIKEIGDDDSI